MFSMRRILDVGVWCNFLANTSRARQILRVGVPRLERTFDGKPVWEGVVHVFDLAGHPSATRAYAWSSPIDRSAKRRFFAVLHVPPVDSPQAAVRAAIVAEAKARHVR
jgi:hypothetical protein